METCFSPIRMVYSAPASDYKVYQATSKEMEKETGEKTFTITGMLPELILETQYVGVFTKIEHPKYGVQYNVESFWLDISKGENGEQAFLQNFVTAKQFKNIIKVYPLPITALKDGTFNYKKVKNFRKDSFEKMKKTIGDNLKYQDALIEFSKYALSINVVKKVVDRYKTSKAAIDVLENNPYQLYTEVKGIGWAKADEIARKVGIDEKDERRIEAAVFFCLETESMNGSTWIKKDQLVKNLEKLLGFIPDEHKVNLALYFNDKIIVEEEEKVSLFHNYETEKYIASELKLRLSNKNLGSLFSEKNLDRDIEEIEKEQGFSFSAKQKEFLRVVNQNKITILTGYAGTGKSKSLTALLALLDKSGKQYLLSAPTGKAAKQITEYTGKDAYTLHRLLNIGVDEKADLSESISTDIFVVDEFSMVDIFLFKALLTAVDYNTRLVFVGDPKQLSSVGVGNCLNDMIESGIIPTIQLTEVFRQALDNGSLKVATDVREGNLELDTKKDVNYFGVKKDCAIVRSSPEDTWEQVKDLYGKILRHGYSVSDIVVISPIRKNGATSVSKLNQLLQETFNPAASNKNELKVNFVVFREGDKVIHIKNDYEIELFTEDGKETGEFGVFNGSIGVIRRIDPEDGVVEVSFANGDVARYDKTNLSELDLSYALTTHKMQGSSAKIVIYIINNTSYILNNRNNVYTALTRTKEKTFVFADYRALKIAVTKEESTKRNTFLCSMLL